MYYFIPSLYGNERFWQADIIPWYYSFSRLEFDDTLHQMRIFGDNQVDSQMICLTYHPHLRYFSHRQNILEIEAYSVFDELQDIHDPQIHILHVEDMDWDPYCEFVYTPFAIVVERKGERYAQIELGQEGFISKVIYWKDGHIYKECLYDDRGFISSILYFEEGRATFRAYLNTEGQWQFMEDVVTGVVDINPEYHHRFKKQRYSDIGELVLEYFDAFLASHQAEEATYIIASNLAHNDMLLEHLPNDAKKVLSFFVERNAGDDLAAYESVLPQMDLVITDRKDFLKKLEEAYPVYNYRMHHLPSFDTRLKLGISQRKKTSKIYYQIDQAVELDIEGIYQVLKFVAQNPLVHVVFGFFNAGGEQIENLEKTIEELVAQRLSAKILVEAADMHGAENPLEENMEDTYRYTIQNFNDESAFFRELEYTRLIVDINAHPNIYTQLAGISTGIPQINQIPSEYVEHKENGWILSGLSEFPEAVHHFIDTLKYWNESLVYSIDKIRENTGQSFIDKWETWLEESKNGR